MKNLKHTLLAALLGALVILPGCSTFDSIVEAIDESVDNVFEAYTPSTEKTSCSERTERQLQDISFVTAASIEMVVRHGEYSPMIVRMRVGKTYVLRLRNRDDEAHSFNAPEFFDSIAVSAAIDNDILDTRCPGPVIELNPGQSFEMKFIAVTDGRYEYRDGMSSVLDLGGFINPAPSGGIIRIEESY